MKGIDEVKAEVLRDIAEGRLKLPSPFYGDECTPTEAEVDVSRPEPYFKFTSSNDAQEAIDTAKRKVASFVEYLNAGCLGNPQLQFRFPQFKEEVYLPNSPSFALNQDVNVHVLREFGNKYHVKGRCRMRGIPTSFSFDRFSPLFVRQVRACKPVRQDGKIYLNVVRSPVVLSIGDTSEIRRSASLVVAVAENMLEPLTSSRLAYLIGDDATNVEMDQLCPGIFKRLALEESILAETLTKLWLIDTQADLSADEVFSTRLKELKNVPLHLIQNLAAKVREYKPKGVVSLYSSREWSLPAFLDGVFAPKDIYGGMENDT